MLTPNLADARECREVGEVKNIPSTAISAQWIRVRQPGELSILTTHLG